MAPFANAEMGLHFFEVLSLNASLVDPIIADVALDGVFTVKLLLMTTVSVPQGYMFCTGDFEDDELSAHFSQR